MTENEHKCIGKTYLVLCIFLVLGTILYFWILRKILSEELQTSALHSIGIEFLHKAYEHVRHLSVLFMKELFLIFNNIEHFSVLYILHLFWSCVMGLGSCSSALWWYSIPVLRRQGSVLRLIVKSFFEIQHKDFSVTCRCSHLVTTAVTSNLKDSSCPLVNVYELGFKCGSLCLVRLSHFLCFDLNINS